MELFKETLSLFPLAFSWGCEEGEEEEMGYFHILASLALCHPVLLRGQRVQAWRCRGQEWLAPFTPSHLQLLQMLEKLWEPVQRF